MSNLRVAFVGVKRPPSELPEGYLETFVKYHLELPWYYARHSRCDVHVTFVEDTNLSSDFSFLGGGSIKTINERDLASNQYDVVVHWRKWYPDLYRADAINVILLQDHSYSEEWKAFVRYAYHNGQLDGLLVFPMWHKQRIKEELHDVVSADVLYEGLTLGVDTSVYTPMKKDPYHMLWASDPGRGLEELISVFLRVWSVDRRFKLTVTYPDYVKPESVARYGQFLQHVAVRHKPSVRNGPELWDLFNTCGILPYTSTFMEPSSRCHRQAMAAGSMVLYPPDRGTPSDLLEDGLTGVVQPIPMWPEIILDNVRTGKWQEIGQNARSKAVSEDWSVQAARFHKFFSERL